jgi:processive 1,2-diacylglycerol beta-glucosyltransferase
MAKILILTTPEGHLSIAQAINEALQEKHTTTFHSIRDSVLDLYTPIYQFFPSMFRVPYEFSQRSSIVSAISRFLKRKLLKKVDLLVKQSRPDLIICSNWIFLPALESLQETNHIPLLNVISDPWTVHPSLISQKAACNMVFDQHQLETCQLINPRAKFAITGWFTRQAFYRSPSGKRLQTKLKLNPHHPTVLIAGGSEGTLMILKLVPALVQLKQPLNILVLCGNNQHLVRGIKSIMRLLKVVNGHSLIVPVGYTTRVEEYVALADIVMGKAGPNTIFESVAVQKPFIAITHITGQEDGNLDLITTHQLGFVEENALKVEKLLQDLLSHPEKLTVLEKPIATMAAFNQQATHRLLGIVDKTLKG